MRTFDLSPLYRSTVGFDHLSRIIDGLQANGDSQAYPPYNIEKLGEDAYRIELAVAGFSLDDIEIVVVGGQLTVRGKTKAEKEEATYLYRGIAARAFERRFQLADYVVVTNACLENGLLRIELARQIPEALKPRRIAINGAAGAGKSAEITKQAA